MGLRDRLLKATAKALADELEKAPRLPAGSTVMSEQDMLRGAKQQVTTYGNQNPLPRNPLMAGVPFGPGQAIMPGAINPLTDTGRAEPRRYEYQVAQNINIGTEQKLVDFKTLRGAAEQIDIVRRCIEVLKNKIISFQWDITIAEDATEKIISEIGGDHVRAMAAAREKFSDQIYRARKFWERPDRSNGLKFIDWLMIALEDILVLDAWAIWPQKTAGGDLYGLQILDGTTIKPLLDDRGMRPMPPFPAYQQILYGFPRTEFTAPSDDADGEFTSDQLSYIIRNRRSFSAYGNSPVERCLPVADLYLRRQQWLRAEYTDGVLPELMFKVDTDFGNDPRLLRELENVLNDDLAGQTEQRHRAKVLPAGFDPVSLDGYGEKFKEVLDTYLVTSICGHFGVLPTEIGFSGRGGLGNSGHQQGEERSAQQIGVAPLVKWLEEMITDLSYQYLGMPTELEFKFMFQENIDSLQDAEKADKEIRGAARTINERRSELGLPLLDTPAADQPMLVAGNSVFIFSPDGIINATTATNEPLADDQVADDADPIAPTKDEPTTPPKENKPNEGEVIPAKNEQTKAGMPNEETAEKAMAKLKALPNAAGDLAANSDKNEDLDLIESPWPLANDHLDETEGIPLDPHIWDSAELTLVNIDELYATDTVMNRDKVADRIESMGQSLLPFKNYPMVYDDGDKQIIMDGHHRLMAMWLLGMDKVPVWLASADTKKEVSKEVRAFLKWASKGKRARQFEFKYLEPIVGEALNRCYFDNDMDTAKALAKAYLVDEMGVDIKKFNENHDERGRFTTGDGAKNPGTRVNEPRRISEKDYQTFKGGSAEKYLVPDGQGGYKFNEERQALHDKIITGALNGVPKSEDPTFHLLGGGPASGKSTMLGSGQLDVPMGKDAVQINADIIKGQIPEYQDMVASGDTRAAAFSHEESSYLSKEIQSEAFAQQKDVVLDSTGNSNAASVLGKIDDAQKNGYSVVANYATVPTQVAIDRAIARAANPNSDSYGRVVPESMITNIHAGVSEVFPQVAASFDKVNLWDTMGQTPTLLATGGAGKLSILDQAGYQAFLDKAVN